VLKTVVTVNNGVYLLLFIVVLYLQAPLHFVCMGRIGVVGLHIFALLWHS
jgi:hypothetical protein